MKNILKQLKSEHIRLIDAFKEIRDMGSLSPEACWRLFLARDLLISHVEKEDKFLYPALRKATGLDPHTKALLDKFEKEMTAVSRTVTTFFDTFQKAGNSLISANAVPILCSTVLDRILEEERLLFPLYSKHVQDPS